MEYILNSAKPSGLPYDKTNNDEPETFTYGINVLIITGIVNQTYNGFVSLDLGFCPIEKTDTIDAILIKINSYALAFVSTTYPNT